MWFQDDHKIMTVSGKGKTAKIWDVKSGRLLFSLNNSKEEYFIVGLSPCGKYLLTSKGKTVLIFDTETFKIYRKFRKHNENVDFACWSPNGKKILTSPSIVKNLAGRIYTNVWDFETSKLLKKIPEKIDFSKSQVWSPDSKLVVSDGRGVNIWDLNSNNAKYELSESWKNQSVIRFSNSGEKVILFNEEYGVIKMFDTSNGKLIYEIGNFGNHINEVIFSPDDSKIAILNGYDIIITDINSNKEIIRIFEDEVYKSINSLKWSPDSKQFITVHHDIKYHNYTAKIWNAENGKLIHFLKGHSDPVRSGQWTSDYNSIITNYFRKPLKSWNSKTCILNTRKFPEFKNIDYEIYNKKVKSVITAFKDSAIVWDLNTGKEKFKIVRDFQYLLYSHNGEKFLRYNNKNIWNDYNTDTIFFYYSENGKVSDTLYVKGMIPRSPWNSETNKFITFYLTQDSIMVWDVNSNKMIQKFKADFNIDQILVSNDDTKLLTVADDNTAKIYSLETGEIECNLEEKIVFDSFAWSHDNKKIFAFSDSVSLKEYDVKTGKVITNYDKLNGYYNSAHLKDPNTIIISTLNGFIFQYDKKNGKLFHTTDLNLFIVNDINFKDSLILSSNNCMSKLNDLKTGEELVQYMAIDSTDYFIKTKENYYMASKNALKWLSFKKNNKTFGFEQFDLKYNRPDKVLEKLRFKDKSRIDAYYKSYLKRIEKMGFKEEDLGIEFHIPQTKISNKNNFPYNSKKSDIILDLALSDSVYNLKRINIWINDVPIYGIKGIDIMEKKSKLLNEKIKVQLSKGNNKVQVSCLNEKGAESYKETLFINFEPIKNEKPDLYLFSIGVSDYFNDNYDLSYAAKDAKDIMKLFPQKSDIYKTIHFYPLLNHDATRENILKIKDILMTSKIDDRVIIFFAGHGVLDTDWEYWLATADVDMSNLSNTSISYDEFENLLDGIPAREKLLLIDACHSGEMDDEIAMNMKEVFQGTKNIVFNASSRNKDSQYAKIENKTSFDIMKEIFSDLRRGTGTHIISSAGGGEFAFEGEMMVGNERKTISNGVFTYSLINALLNKKADFNNDGNITISELKKFVFEDVEKRTMGYQKPTSRRENLEIDFVIW